MVVEAPQITSLKRPPDGFVWEPERRALQVKARTRTTYDKRSPGGSLPGAEATADLPELRLGVDPLPTTCRYCGGGLLNAEPPLGAHQRGTISCSTCSRALCWTARGVAPNPLPRATAPAPAPEPVVARRLLRFRRTDGCGPACVPEEGHDPATHEGYGRNRLLAEQAAQSTGMAAFGPLFIDFDRAAVAVEGRRVRLTATEWRIMRYLAARAGRVCPYFDLTAAVWDHERAMIDAQPGPASGRFALQRVHLGRLRAALGPAGALIQTVPGVGLILNRRLPAASAEAER